MLACRDDAICVHGDAIAALAEAGFDLVHAFATAAVAREPGLEVLADPARPLGLLVGNTRALWPRFLAARRADPELAAHDPLIATPSGDRPRIPRRPRVVPAHPLRDRLLPMQRLAVAAGFGYARADAARDPPAVTGRGSALRAVIALAGEPPRPVAIAPPCRCGEPCLAALDRARGETTDLRPWIAVRDACPLGREHRYGDDQLAYHYTQYSPYCAERLCSMLTGRDRSRGARARRVPSARRGLVPRSVRRADRAAARGLAADRRAARTC